MKNADAFLQMMLVCFGHDSGIQGENNPAECVKIPDIKHQRPLNGRFGHDPGIQGENTPQKV